MPNGVWPKCRSPSKPIGPEWDTTIAGNAAAAAAAAAPSSADTADMSEPGGNTDTQGVPGGGSVSGVSSDAASAGGTGSTVPPASNGHPPVRTAGHNRDGGFVQVIMLLCADL